LISGHDRESTRARCEAQDWQQRLGQAAPSDTARGRFFNGVLDAVRTLKSRQTGPLDCECDFSWS
jgi:hypothetical protein